MSAVEKVEVSCKFGTLVAYQAGDPGVFDEIAVDLVRPDGGLVQVATIGTSGRYRDDAPDPRDNTHIHSYLWNGDDEDCEVQFYTKPDGKCVYWGGADHMCSEINFRVEFQQGGRPDADFPCDGKLLLVTYLEEAPCGFEDEQRWTLDRESCELPMVFLKKNEDDRKKILSYFMPDALKNAAALLNRNRDRLESGNYRINSTVDVMNIVSDGE